MRYYVLSDDGQKYGPADVATLNGWIAENRLLPHQMLEEEASGARFAARAVPGLNFPTAPADSATPAGGPAYSGYYRGDTSADDGSRDLQVAWILFGVSFLACCATSFGGFLVPGVGVYFANQARKKGHPKATTPFVLNMIWLVSLVLLFVLSIALRGMIQSGQIKIPGRTA